MLYQSTRSSITATPAQALLQGIAPDGGLYIAPGICEGEFDVSACLKKDFFGMAGMILNAVLPGVADMEPLVREAYRGRFEEKDPTPLVKVGERYVLELFRGPTCAFKDVALSVLPRLVAAAREQAGEKGTTVILTATSGDTGKAALAGFADAPGTRIIVFFPENGVSPVQQAQMVTQSGANVKVCAVRGNFDDCQRGVKKAFAELAKPELRREGISFSSANSINIGRLAPQIVYYFSAYSALMRRGEISLGDKVDFCVPTGNFGDILAGYYAKLLGLPVGRLICASNSNNILTDFFSTGVYDTNRPFLRTTSPSMDILVSSNLERFLFLASGCDSAFTAQCMAQLQDKGRYEIPEAMRAKIADDFACGCCSEAEVEETIGKVWRDNGYLCDTHTAVAMKVADELREDRPMVVLSTASPYKFSAAVLKAIGGDTSGSEFEQMRRLGELTGIEVPESLADLEARPVLHRDVTDRDTITEYILSVL